MRADVVLCVVMALSSIARANLDKWTALSIEVAPQSEECFFEELEQGKSFELDFEVIRGGLLDIELVVTNPRGQVVYQKLSFFNTRDGLGSQNEGMFNFKPEVAGVYRFFFNNKMSRWTPKVVSFGVPGSAAASHKELAKLEHLGPVVESIQAIEGRLEEIQSLQDYLRLRETVHRDTQESTNARAQWLSILESGILIAASAGQLYMIQSWFSNRGIRGRV